MFTIHCKATCKLFPPAQKDEIGYMVCKYVTDDVAILPHELQGENTFVAKGSMLPYSPFSDLILYGDKWEERNGSYTLNILSYDENIPNTYEGVSFFLKTLDGCDDASINQIMRCVKDKNPMDVLDKDHEIIKTAIKNQYSVQKICEAIDLHLYKKDAFFYVSQFLSKNIPVTVAVQTALCAENREEIMENPFKFVLDELLPYSIAKRIANQNNVPCDSMCGFQAAFLDILKQSEGKTSGPSYDDSEPAGNTYILYDDLFNKAGLVLGVSPFDNKLQIAFDELVEKKYCVCKKEKYVYRKVTADAEYGIAKEVLRLMSPNTTSRDYKLDIYALENKKRMRLAPEQRNAVKVALSNTVTLLIGGPGTGKTTIEQFIIEIYRLYHRENVLLVAPTGKAARRMSESTGEPAFTVHKALGVSAGNEVIQTDKKLDAGLILIDEASMLDAQITFALLKAINTGTKVVFVGDTNQLPSVGVGNVLFELINSRVVPVAALETVYRQKAGSTIATNCARIKRGLDTLEYSDTFQFCKAASQEDAVRMVLSSYKAELDSGLPLEKICLLSPYRRSTLTGVNALNHELQQMLVNEDTPHFNYGSNKFYLGDRVMFMDNKENVANGDVGTIVNINLSQKTFDVDFGDSKILSYKKSDLRSFTLAYGISIHKSQGAEFDTCIITLMDEHEKMLKRNLIYTAISRAKKKVILIGTQKALQTAIKTEDVSKRRSRLGEILAILSKAA